VPRCTPLNSAHVVSDDGDRGGSRRARPHADLLVCEITGGRPGLRYVLDAGSHAWTHKPGSYLVAAPKSRQVQPLLGWPVGQSSLQPPAVVVSTLSWA
jgi:hypothetical protein